MVDETQPQVLEVKQPNLEEDCPEIYFHGMEIGMSLSDINVTISTGGRKKVRLYMSFTTAKTFAKNLGQAIDVLEQRTKQEIMTMEEVEQGLKSDRTNEPDHNA